MITLEEIKQIEEKQKKLGTEINYFFHKHERLKCQLYLKDLLSSHMRLETNSIYRGSCSDFVSHLLLLLEYIDPGEEYIMHLKIDE